MTDILEACNIIVLDVETLHSANDCRSCFGPAHSSEDGCGYYEPIGWRDFAALGLSIGGYYDYADGLVYWFDEASLITTLAELVERQPLVVTYNGTAFDLPLLKHLCELQAGYGDAFAAAWERLTLASYDILATIWERDLESKYVKGLNGLGAVAKANGFGEKLLPDGALAPVLWRDGRFADVINYCQQDILLTKGLFELVVAGQPIKRSNGTEVLLRFPQLPTPPQEGDSRG